MATISRSGRRLNGASVLVGSIIAGLVFIVAIGQLRGVQGQPTASGSDGYEVVTREEHDRVDWDGDQLAGLTFHDGEDAAAILGFDLLLPAFPSTSLVKVIVSDPGRVPLAQREATMFFDSADLGRIILREGPSSWAPADIVQFKHDSPNRRLVHVEGHPALHVSSQYGSRIMWIEGGRRFDLLGPDLSSDDVLTLAGLALRQG